MHGRRPADPAAEAGVRPGDVIVSFNGTPFSDWDAFQAQIRANADGDAAIEVRRDGEFCTVDTNTTVTLRQTSLDDDALTKVGFLGVQREVRLATGGPIYTLDQMGTMTVETAKALGQLPVKVYEVGRAIVGLQERDPESPVSIVGGGRFAGEAAASDAFPLTEKLVTLLFLIAELRLLHRHVRLRAPAAARRRPHRRCPLRGPRAWLAGLGRRSQTGHVDVAKPARGVRRRGSRCS